jgi:mannose-6-phosphate isomerase
LQTAVSLAVEYPDDPGIVISLLLNRVTLARGEALYLPAGNIHAYLDGLGVELMAASDNVLRGGLTPKHIDVPELLAVLDFTPGPLPYLRASGGGSVGAAGASAAGAGDFGVGAGAGAGAGAAATDAVGGAADTARIANAAGASDASDTAGRAGASGVEVFRPDVPDFVLVRVADAGPGAQYPLTGPGIAICTAGEIRIDGVVSSVVVARGESVYITPDEGALRFGGDGELFLATTGE